MFRRDLLPLVRPRPSDTGGLLYVEGTEEDGGILAGTARSAQTGETYEIRSGYLDLLGLRTGAVNLANLTNFLPGAGPSYEPLWRTRSLSLLTGERFPNERELGIIARLTRARGGLYLDLGCSAGLYTKTLAAKLGDEGHVLGMDVSPSMLKEAVRRARDRRHRPSFVRADAANIPFGDATFSGAVCGGSLNEFRDPARVLRETRRVLQPGARLAMMGILAAKSARGWRLQRLLSRGGLRFFEPDQLRSLLDHAGFEPEDLEVYHPVFFVGATRR